MGALQPQAGATPPRAPKRGGPGAPMAHRGRGQLPPPTPQRPGGDFVASLCAVNGTLECPPQEDTHPYRDLSGGFSKHLQDALFPPWIIHDRVGGMHSGRGVGARVGPVLRRDARPEDPCATIRRLPARGVGATHPAKARHDPWGGP